MNISHICISFQEQLAALKTVAPNVDPAKLSQLLSCSYALVSDEALGLGLPDFPVDNIPLLGEIFNRFPETDPSLLVNRLYPYKSFLTREALNAVEDTYKTFQLSTQEPDLKSKVEEVKTVSGNNFADCYVCYGNAYSQIRVNFIFVSCRTAAARS